ncbi:PepSY domain-containing protein [Leisingera aquaemixtae]|uniref:PepSY domain-containing protein n=1 Tax=Leisingera aquaemixtae TaxID=1396826 RepID=A0ABY5WN35_9RHOB|nr:PepSY domain-containing protein [Leisingera aquaemixtae]UWQ42845.1 PepSY domain-containing protein [Leisingera aquaemixtae]
MRHSLKLLALVLTLPAAAAFASDSTPSADTQAKIRDLLTSQGYEVRKIEAEDGQFEAYAVKDGKKYEVYLNGKLEVVKIKEDD